ncbi:MAG: hypothetical protein HKO04_15295 [Silicimonas sp.]|nr:hypothetical protein [Silicimonas sp.]
MTSGDEGQVAKLALAAHPVATLVVDLEGCALYANTAARKAFGLEPKSSQSTRASISDWQLRRMMLTDLLRMASTSSNWIPAIFSRNGETVHARMRGLRPAGNATLSVLITSVRDSTTPFVAHAQQIKKLNKQLHLYRKMAGELQASIEVSKVLERELVHRVKNNLAIISGLLHQQARSAGDQVVSAALKDAASRIKSVAVVHELLDSSRETDVVDLERLISELVNGIREALCPKHIRLETETRSAIVHIDVALPLSLLINELVTNAIKHAFPERDSGRIQVRFLLHDSMIDIRVVDDGIGLPEASARQPRMITALADQVGGTIESRIENGTEWILRIPFNREGAMTETIPEQTP